MSDFKLDPILGKLRGLDFSEEEKQWVLDQIKSAISPDESEKEVITVLHYGAEAPNEPQEGDLWINSADNYIYTFDSSGMPVQGDTPKTDVLYITADTSHIYIFNGISFTDVTGEKTDDIIYVNNLDELSAYQDAGIYQVCHMLRNGMRGRYYHYYYTMVIKVMGSTHTTSYTLSNNDCYLSRSYDILTSEWKEDHWSKFIYVSEDQLNGALSDVIRSEGISSVWKGTQSEYNAINTKDDDVLYIVLQDIPDKHTFIISGVFGQLNASPEIELTAEYDPGMTLGQWIDSEYNHFTSDDYPDLESDELIIRHDGEEDVVDGKLEGGCTWYCDGGNAEDIEQTVITPDLAFYVEDCMYCLLGDTLVTMADGTAKQIRDIVIGDKVRSLDLETNEIVSREVLYTDAAKNKTASVWDEWVFSDGTVLKTAHRHEFYNVDKGKFTYMDEWNTGDRIYKSDGTTPALVEHIQHTEIVNHYKITLQGSTNYFANGCLTGDRYCKVPKRLV